MNNEISEELRKFIARCREELNEREEIIDMDNEEEYIDNLEILERLNPDDFKIDYLKRLTIDNMTMSEKFTVGNMLNFFNINNKGRIYHKRNDKYYSTTNKIVHNRGFLIRALYDFIDKLGNREEELAKNSIEVIRKQSRRIEKLNARIYYSNTILEKFAADGIRIENRP